MSWTGEVVRRARRYWRPRLPLPCSRCGLDVHDDQPGATRTGWEVDHLRSRVEGGDLTDPANQWPAHARCNGQAGQALSTRRRNRARAGLRIAPNRRAWS